MNNERFLKEKVSKVFDPDKFKIGHAYAISEKGDDKYMSAILKDVSPEELVFGWLVEGSIKALYVSLDNLYRYDIRIMTPSEEEE